MKHVFTLFAFALMSGVSAQTVLPPIYPYNPDSDGDEFVAVSDVLMSVASYDNGFQAQSIMVDTLSLEEAIQMLLQQQSLNQQALIQSQQALIDGLTNSLAGVEGFEPCLLNWTCGCPLAYQGYNYETVQIGEQCWFAENLRSENYKNGEPTPAHLSDDQWEDMEEGAAAILGEDEGCVHYSPDIDACDPIQALHEFGRLYNWYAVIDLRGLCPSGWHVPTDGEWYSMTETLGGDAIAGEKMKTTFGWLDNGNGTNSSGFSGLPGGRRLATGYFNYAGNFGYWWSSSSLDNSNDALYRSLNSSLEQSVNRGNTPPNQGFSIRCIQDSE